MKTSGPFLETPDSNQVTPWMFDKLFANQQIMLLYVQIYIKTTRKKQQSRREQNQKFVCNKKLKVVQNVSDKKDCNYQKQRDCINFANCSSSG